jgi:prolyl 4-hydroxylase
MEFHSDFLSPAERELLPWATIDYSASNGWNFISQSAEITEHRTSSSAVPANIEWLYDRVIDYVKQHIPDVTRSCIDPIQFTRYSQGQQYIPHWDYFNNIHADTHVTPDRRATVIIYLNDSFTGGHTAFPNLNITVRPQAGSALFFRYDYDSTVKSLTLHSGEPVVKGVKYIATAWIRHGTDI